MTIKTALYPVHVSVKNFPRKLMYHEMPTLENPRKLMSTKKTRFTVVSSSNFQDLYFYNQQFQGGFASDDSAQANVEIDGLDYSMGWITLVSCLPCYEQNYAFAMLMYYE